jgi:hypothetical protein
MANSAFLQRFLPPWTVVTGNTVGVTNQGYITNVAGTTTVSLPTTAAVGDVFNVGTMQGDFQITQAAGQQILLAGGFATTDPGGSVTSNAVGDSILLICIVADTTWMAIGGGGTRTVV